MYISTMVTRHELFMLLGAYLENQLKPLLEYTGRLSLFRVRILTVLKCTHIAVCSVLLQCKTRKRKEKYNNQSANTHYTKRIR